MRFLCPRVLPVCPCVHIHRRIASVVVALCSSAMEPALATATNRYVSKMDVYVYIMSVYHNNCNILMHACVCVDRMLAASGVTQIFCSHCRGTGVDKLCGVPSEQWTCKRCKGYGYTCSVNTSTSGINTSTTTTPATTSTPLFCSPCKGTGIDKVGGVAHDDWTCHRCRGYGYLANSPSLA